MKYYSDDQVTATLKAQSSDWEKDWRGSYLAYMDHVYCTFMQMFDNKGHVDERLTFVESYNQICKGLASLPRVPDLYIRIAVSRSVEEDCKILDEIVQMYKDGKWDNKAKKGCPFLVLSGNREKDRKAVESLDPMIRLMDSEGYLWSGKEIRRTYEKLSDTGCDTFSGTFYMAM